MYLVENQNIKMSRVNEQLIIVVNSRMWHGEVNPQKCYSGRR
jgi:hypothetical protein